MTFAGSPHQLHAKTQQIEGQMGRPAERAVNAPRVIDLDILLVGSVTISSDELTVPHPRLCQRRFVLEPLAAICPDLKIPGEEKTVADLLDTLESSEPPLTVVTREW